MAVFRDSVLAFIADLRGSSIRISVAESIDAMRAIAAIGLDQRGRVREALAAALIKDETDRAIFNEVFALHFGGGARHAGAGGQRPPQRSGLHGVGGEDAGTEVGREEPSIAVPAAGGRPDATRPQPRPEEPANAHRDDRGGNANQAAVIVPFDIAEVGGATDGEDSDAPAATNGVPAVGGLATALAAIVAEASSRGSDAAASDGTEAGRGARLREYEQLPFARYGDLEYEQARDTLVILRRRLRVRLARRLRIAGSGHIDFRRTVRAAIQHGGTLVDLRYRSRRPRHCDLLLLGDVSGSMHYGSVLMLEMIAGARELFRHVRSFVYVDHLAEATFERGHLVTTPAVDLYARSDFGRVLTELWDRRATLMTRASVVVIMGDGRNNRRPPRVELLRDLRRQCRSVIWLTPEHPERWGTGDSALLRYAREVNQIAFCGNLRDLERDLAHIV